MYRAHFAVSSSVMTRLAQIVVAFSLAACGSAVTDGPAPAEQIEAGAAGEQQAPEVSAGAPALAVAGSGPGVGGVGGSAGSAGTATEIGGVGGSGGASAAGSASGGSAIEIGGTPGVGGGGGGAGAAQGGSDAAGTAGQAQGGSAGASGAAGSGGALGDECRFDHHSQESIQIPDYHKIAVTFSPYPYSSVYLTALDLTPFAGRTISLVIDGVQQGQPFAGGGVWRPLAPQVQVKTELSITVTPFATAAGVMPAGGLAVYCLSRL